jgi:hypothetical protein
MTTHSQKSPFILSLLDIDVKIAHRCDESDYAEPSKHLKTVLNIGTLVTIN